MPLKHKLYNILNMIKGFEVGFTSRSSNHIMMDYEGKRYLVEFTEIKNPSEHMLQDINDYIPTVKGTPSVECKIVRKEDK